MLHQIKAQQFYTVRVRSLSTALSPTENSRIQEIFKALSDFLDSTFQGRLNFQVLFKNTL